MTCQSREGNLDEIFKYENQACLPSLSDFGKLRPRSKSDLVQCLEHDIEPTDKALEMDAVLLVGAAVVNILRPNNTKTFDSYAQDIFLPFVEKCCAKCVDIVWDEYIKSSLKAQAKGQGNTAKCDRINKGAM